MTLKIFLAEFTGQTKVSIYCRQEVIYSGTVMDWFVTQEEQQGELELSGAEVFDEAELSIAVK